MILIAILALLLSSAIGTAPQNATGTSSLNTTVRRSGREPERAARNVREPDRCPGNLDLDPRELNAHLVRRSQQASEQLLAELSELTPAQLLAKRKVIAPVRRIGPRDRSSTAKTHVRVSQSYQ